MHGPFQDMYCYSDTICFAAIPCCFSQGLTAHSMAPKVNKILTQLRALVYI